MTINYYILIKLKVININDSISILTKTVKFNYWNNWLQYYEHLIFNINGLGIKPEQVKQRIIKGVIFSYKIIPYGYANNTVAWHWFGGK